MTMPQDSYNTEMPEKRNEQLATDDAEVRIDLALAEEVSKEKIEDFGTASSWKRIIERIATSSGGPYVDLIVKGERARASALMDANCLKFLGLLYDKRQLSVAAICEHIEKNDDWLKIALLIKADFLENLDSMLRITAEGVEAWAKLQQFKKMSRTE
jgi:hypothetical protein